MESIRSMLLLGLILVFVAVKGEYPSDYDCEDFRQVKRDKVCEKFNGTCPAECPGKCSVCCLNESLQCQCLDVQPQVESEGNMDADDMSPAHFFHCKGGINGSKLEGNEDVQLRDLCEEIEFDTFAEDGCELCFVLAESSEYRAEDVDEIMENATSACNPSKDEFQRLKVPRGVSNGELNQCKFKELRAYKKCSPQDSHKLVDTEILIPKFKHQPEDDKMCVKFMGMNMDEDDMYDFENATDFVIDGQGRGIWNGSNPPPRIRVNESLGRLRDMDIENLEAAVFIREYEVERQLSYKMSHGDHRCRYGHFFVTDRPLWVGQFSEISGPSGDITLENNDIFHKLRPDWYGCRFCGPAYLYVVLDPFNKLRDRKGCRCDGWHKVQKINIPCHWRDDRVSIQPIVVPHHLDHGDFLMYCDYGHISFHGVHCSRGIDMERTDVYNLLDEMEFTDKPGEGYGPTGRCVKRRNHYYDHYYQEKDNREICAVEVYSAQMLMKFKQRFMNISGETCGQHQDNKPAMGGNRDTQNILRVVEKHCEKRQSGMKNRSYSDEPEFDDIMIDVDDIAEDCGLRKRRMIDNSDDSEIEACLERNRSSVVNALIKSDVNDTEDMGQQNLTMKALMKIVCSQQKNMDSPVWCERLARCTMYSISSERENIKDVVRDDDNKHYDERRRRKRSEQPKMMLNNGQRYLQAIYHKCHDRLTNEDVCPENIDSDDHRYDHNINIYDEYWNLTYWEMGEGKNMSMRKNDSSKMVRHKRSMNFYEYGYYGHYSEAPEGPGILRDRDGVREITDALRGSWSGWGPCECDDIRVQKCGDQKLREYFEDDTKGLCVAADYLEDHHKCSKEHFKQSVKNFQQLYGYDLNEAKRRARKCCAQDTKPERDDVRCSYCTRTMKDGLYVYKYLALDEPKCKLIGVTECPDCHSYDYSGGGYRRGSGYGSGSGSGHGSGSGRGSRSGLGSRHGKGNFSDHGKASGNEPK